MRKKKEKKKGMKGREMSGEWCRLKEEKMKKKYGNVGDGKMD